MANKEVKKTIGCNVSKENLSRILQVAEHLRHSGKLSFVNKSAAVNILIEYGYTTYLLKYPDLIDHKAEQEVLQNAQDLLNSRGQLNSYSTVNIHEDTPHDNK